MGYLVLQTTCAEYKSSKTYHERPDLRVARQRHSEATSGTAGLGGERGVAYNVRGGCLVEGLCGVHLFYRVVAHRVGVELALDDRRACRRFGKEIGSVIATAADADGGDVGGGEDIGHEPLVVRTGLDRGEVAALFEGLAFGAAVLPRLVGGADSGDGLGAAARQFCRVKCRVGGELPRLLGWGVGVGVHGERELRG